jgi:hypothetical protein
MEPNGPAWTNMMPKGYQKGAKNDPNGAKRRSKKQNKTMFRKSQKMLVPGRFPHSCR